MPQLTIVTVTFNDLAGLKRTRASVLAATFHDLEHLIVDGGSTDGTVDYLQGLPTAVRWSSKPDKGPYDAMNKGATDATGDWIMFLNSGDTLAGPTALAELLKAAHNSAASLVYGDHFHRGKLRRAKPLEELHHLLEKGDAKGWLRGHPCHQAVIARAALVKSMPFDLGYRIAADFHWMERVRQLGHQSCSIAHPICRYEPGGLSSRHFLRCTVEWWKVAKLAVGPQPIVKNHFRKALGRYARRKCRAKAWAFLGTWAGLRN